MTKQLPRGCDLFEIDILWSVDKRASYYLSESENRDVQWGCYNLSLAILKGSDRSVPEL